MILTGQSLLNLASNAVDACIFDEDTDKKWRVELKTKKENGSIRFDVADTGMGMSDVVRKKLFTSFFSTKGHRGTGLGLLVTMPLTTLLLTHVYAQVLKESAQEEEAC